MALGPLRVISSLLVEPTTAHSVNGPFVAIYKCAMKSAGIAGRSPTFASLQTGHGMPAPPQRQAFG